MYEVYKQIAIKMDMSRKKIYIKVFECSYGVQMKCIHSSEQVNNTRNNTVSSNI